MSLLEKLAEIEGYPDGLTMMQDAITDSVCPGICTQCEEYTTEVEPDQDHGWCEACGTGTVVSALRLGGII